MLRFMLYPLVLVTIVISCMGQTFQYSRGWTNGKRSSTHFHEDPTLSEIFEFPESERRLERCIVQLQRFIHNPFLIRPSYGAGSINTNGNSNLFPSGSGGISSGSSGSIRHQSNEIFEDLASVEPAEFSTKHN